MVALAEPWEVEADVVPTLTEPVEAEPVVAEADVVPTLAEPVDVE